jgi:hypothetical protein
VGANLQKAERLAGQSRGMTRTIPVLKMEWDEYGRKTERVVQQEVTLEPVCFRCHQPKEHGGFVDDTKQWLCRDCK